LIVSPFNAINLDAVENERKLVKKIKHNKYSTRRRTVVVTQEIGEWLCRISRLSSACLSSSIRWGGVVDWGGSEGNTGNQNAGVVEFIP
jgi:hypothetical protein